MPTYEFRCPEGHNFERFYRKISDAEAVVTCPECGAVAERRLSAGAGLLFKGSGFYLTDYGRNAHRGAPPAEAKGGEGTQKEGAPETKASDSSGKGSDTKPATPAPAAKPAKGGDSGGGSPPAK